MTDSLQTMFDAQRKLQSMMGIDPQYMEPTDLLGYVTTMVVACTDELHEALNETGWKPWASSDHFNTEAFRDELTDAWLFLLNLMLASGMTGRDLTNRYHEKRVNAERRHNEKYDGISTKCPICKRAYDNKAVECYPAMNATVFNGVESAPARPAWCAREVMMGASAAPDQPHCPQCRSVYGSGARCNPATVQGFGWCDKWKQSLLLMGDTMSPIGGERVA